MPLAAWLISLVGPIVTKVLTQLTVGYVTYKGLDAALNALLSKAQANWSGLPADIAAYLAIAGVNTAISIIAGALAARIAMIPLKRLKIK